MHRLPVAVMICLLVPLANAAQLKGAVYSPKAGVVCDRKAQFCADAQGISLGYTREYLGAKAEKAMMDRIASVGQANYDLTWFAFSNGVDCKTALKRCTVGKHSETVDAAHTKALFGQ